MIDNKIKAVESTKHTEPLSPQKTFTITIDVDGFSKYTKRHTKMLGLSWKLRNYELTLTGPKYAIITWLWNYYWDGSWIVTTKPNLSDPNFQFWTNMIEEVVV